MTENEPIDEIALAYTQALYQAQQDYHDAIKERDEARNRIVYLNERVRYYEDLFPIMLLERDQARTECGEARRVARRLLNDWRYYKKASHHLAHLRGEEDVPIEYVG